ncbi:MFS transporter [Pseudomonadales bacterium]|nr:MFS transporter [Pseudomonadales bacterium]
MKPLHYYFMGTGTWFFAYGLQSVIFAWLVTMVLQESAEKVGLAQMAFLLPATLLMLLGGSLADHFGGKLLAIIGHLVAATAPLFLTLVTWLGGMSYNTVIIFAVVMGCAQALVTPARDGLLANLAGGNIQRRVVQASMIQFGLQMTGFLVASFADEVGPIRILLIQASVLMAGTFFYFRMKVEHIPSPNVSNNMAQHIFRSVQTGYRTVRASTYLTGIVIQNCAMGVFFMGSYIVTVPLLIRETYGGSARELSLINALNSFGFILTILLLLRIGNVHRQGRALLCAQGIGAIILAGGGLELGLTSLAVCIFLWGVCGGLAMTMSRTVMQELAPPDQRARMMAFYAFSLMGSGPVGALLSGYLVEWYGPATALIISSFAMLSVVTYVSLTSTLWKLDASKHETIEPLATEEQ